MGYAASGFGNHELDFGKDQFLTLRETGGFPFLAANLKVTKPTAKELEATARRIFTRGGARVGWWAFPTRPPSRRPWRTASTAWRCCGTS